MPKLSKGEKDPKTLARIAAEVAILRRIQPCSVRAVAYQMFIAGLIPSMAKKHTNQISEDLVYAREARLAPWAWIVDEGRAIEQIACWDDPAAFAKIVGPQYRRKLWTEQPISLTCVAEKGTVRGTVLATLQQYRVPFFVTHGFSSATKVYDLAQEAAGLADGRDAVVLYIGDYDPSGMSMSEVDLPQRFERYGGQIRIVRVALDASDVADLDLAGATFSVREKTSDSRAPGFEEAYGDRCAELDALDPNVLRSRLRQAVLDHLDADLWDEGLEQEADERASLVKALGAWAKTYEQSDHTEE